MANKKILKFKLIPIYTSSENNENNENNKILTNDEKNYLGHVIEPFKERVQYISKMPMRDYSNNFYSINIIVHSIDPVRKYDYIELPYFESYSKKYEKMEPMILYTLEELGIKKELYRFNVRMRKD